MLAELWNDLRYRLRALTRGGDLDREMEDEIEAHLAREADALERRGLPAAEARRQARARVRRPGGRQGTEPRHARNQTPRGLHPGCRLCVAAHPPLAGALAHDRRASRALTIGSATIVFSVVNAVLLRPLPFGDPDRLALVWETRANTAQNVVGGHEFPEWARSNRTFDGLSPMIYDEGVHLTGAGDPMALLGVRVAATFFQVMGVTPAIGRTFTADEDQRRPRRRRGPERSAVAVAVRRRSRRRRSHDPPQRSSVPGRRRDAAVVRVPAGQRRRDAGPVDADRRQHRALCRPALPLRRRAA